MGRSSAGVGSRVKGLHLLLLACLVALAWLVLPGTASAFPNGDFIVLEGPFAGTPLNRADLTGHVSKNHNEDSGAHGFIRGPTEQCPYAHFEGFIKGKEIKPGQCVRVSSPVYSQRFLIQMAEAVDYEMAQKGAGADAAQKRLGKAFDELPKAQKAGRITAGEAEQIGDELQEINRLDGKAEKAYRDGEFEEAEKLLAKALKKKHALIDGAPPALVRMQQPTVEKMDAAFQAPQSQTLYTETASSPDGRKLTYSWALVEHNDFTCINFAANTPADNQSIWHHGDTQGCNHSLEGPNGHVGTITVVVRDRLFSCLASYDGSNTGTGPPSTCVQDQPG
jgi:hypothetical protein